MEITRLPPLEACPPERMTGRATAVLNGILRASRPLLRAIRNASLLDLPPRERGALISAVMDKLGEEIIDTWGSWSPGGLN